MSKDEAKPPRAIVITGILDAEKTLHQTIQIAGYDDHDISGVMSDFTAALGAVLSAHYSTSNALKALRDIVLPGLISEVCKNMKGEDKVEDMPETQEEDDD